MIYGNKHVVFEQVGVDGTSYIWNSTDNLDDDNCINNYSESKIRGNLNQNVIEYLSNDLQSELVATTVQTAKNGMSTTLVFTTDKLFLQAEKEIGYTNNSTVEERNALITWTYWTTHTTTSNHIKYDSSSTARGWWNRSPMQRNNNTVCCVISYGQYNYNPVDTANYYISSCFAW